MGKKYLNFTNLLLIFINLFIFKELKCEKINKIILSRSEKIILFYMPSVENLVIALSKALNDIGFENVYISDNISKDEDSIYLILNGAQIENSHMPKRYLMYQTEQIGSYWFNENYIKNLKQAIAIFDYSYANITYLNNKFGFDIIYLPFNYHPIIKKKILCYEDLSFEADKSRDIDVLFLGALNDRRLIIQKELQKQRLNVLFLNYVPLVELYELIKRAKVVLNMHYYNQMTILETSRLSLLWANQACVLTETSNDMHADSTYKDCAFFSRYQDIPANCKKLVNDLETRIEIAKNGHQIFTTKHLLINDLKKIFVITD